MYRLKIPVDLKINYKSSLATEEGEIQHKQCENIFYRFLMCAITCKYQYPTTYHVSCCLCIPYPTAVNVRLKAIHTTQKLLRLPKTYKLEYQANKN